MTTDRLYARATGREPHREMLESRSRPPQFRWPSARAKLPTHCGHCGARLLRGDVPSVDYPVVDVDCWTCSRTVCELIHDSMRRPMTPEQWAALPGAVFKNGRPKGVGKPGPGRPPTSPTGKPCVDCGIRRARFNRDRCRICASLRGRETREEGAP